MYRTRYPPVIRGPTTHRSNLVPLVTEAREQMKKLGEAWSNCILIILNNSENLLNFIHVSAMLFCIQASVLSR